MHKIEGDTEFPAGVSSARNAPPLPSHSRQAIWRRALGAARRWCLSLLAPPVCRRRLIFQTVSPVQRRSAMDQWSPSGAICATRTLSLVPWPCVARFGRRLLVLGCEARARAWNAGRPPESASSHGCTRSAPVLLALLPARVALARASRSGIRRAGTVVAVEQVGPGHTIRAFSDPPYLLQDHQVRADLAGRLAIPPAGRTPSQDTSTGSITLQAAIIARLPEPHRLRAKSPRSELNAFYKSRASPRCLTLQIVQALDLQPRSHMQMRRDGFQPPLDRMPRSGFRDKTPPRRPSGQRRGRPHRDQLG
jgi:hypothetical protein